MPCSPGSRAATLVMPRIANLLAVQATRYGMPARPSIEDAFTIEPPPAVVMDPTTARMPRNVPPG